MSKLTMVVMFALPMLKQVALMLAGRDSNQTGSDDKAAKILLMAYAALEVWVNEQSSTPLILPDSDVEYAMRRYGLTAKDADAII